MDIFKRTENCIKEGNFFFLGDLFIKDISHWKVMNRSSLSVIYLANEAH